MNHQRLASMNRMLRELLKKYGVTAAGELAVARSERFGAPVCLQRKGDAFVPLLPWRMERRLIELRHLVLGQTVEDVSTLRFCALSAEMTLEQLLYREFDLCLFLGGAAIRSVFAVKGGKRTANAIVKLGDGKSASVECASGLPPGTEAVDRHEIIARRGVACDRVVDTQVPQASLYLFSADGVRRFSDPDAELFGFAPDEIHLIRAAFQALKHTETAAEWSRIHERLKTIVVAALESESARGPAIFTEAC